MTQSELESTSESDLECDMDGNLVWTLHIEAKQSWKRLTRSLRVFSVQMVKKGS